MGCGCDSLLLSLADSSRSSSLIHVKMETCWLSTSIPPGKGHLKAWNKDTRRRTDSKAFCSASRRRLLSESVALTVSVLYILPALSEPLQGAKEAESFQVSKRCNGVKIQDIIDGEGEEAKEGDFVQVNYVCRRSNGYFVHSTVDQFTGESMPVILLLDEKETIKGLKDVLVGMKVGGKRRALIPPNVGYVNESLKPIPDEFGPRRSLLSHVNEPLVFEVQLLKVL